MLYRACSGAASSFCRACSVATCFLREDRWQQNTPCVLSYRHWPSPVQTRGSGILTRALCTCAEQAALATVIDLTMQLHSLNKKNADLAKTSEVCTADRNRIEALEIALAESAAISERFDMLENGVRQALLDSHIASFGSSRCSSSSTLSASDKPTVPSSFSASAVPAAPAVNKFSSSGDMPVLDIELEPLTEEGVGSDSDTEEGGGSRSNSFHLSSSVRSQLAGFAASRQNIRAPEATGTDTESCTISSFAFPSSQSCAGPSMAGHRMPLLSGSSVRRVLVKSRSCAERSPRAATPAGNECPDSVFHDVFASRLIASQTAQWSSSAGSPSSQESDVQRFEASVNAALGVRMTLSAVSASDARVFSSTRDFGGVGLPAPETMHAETYIASAAAAVACGCTDKRNTAVHTVMSPDTIGEATPEKRQRVLVVDEDKGHCKLLTKLLLKDFSNAVQVDCAYDAASALQLLMAVHSVAATATSASAYDIVLIKGPDLSGQSIVEFARNIQSESESAVDMGGRGNSIGAAAAGVGSAQCGGGALRAPHFVAMVRAPGDVDDLERLGWQARVLVKPVKRDSLSNVVSETFRERDGT